MSVKNWTGKKPKAPRAKSVRVDRPKQVKLAGMEDNKLEDLDEIAKDYATVRDRRMELTKQEVSLNSELLTLMKKHSKTSYNCDGITINVVHEKEKVKVKVAKEEE